jgi:hypothetical protein
MHFESSTPFMGAGRECPPMAEAVGIRVVLKIDLLY